MTKISQGKSKRVLVLLGMAFFIFLTTYSLGMAETSVSSLRGSKFEIGGELELEFIDSQSDQTVLTDVNGDKIGGDNNPNQRMSIDTIVITPKVRVAPDILFEADIEFGPDKKVKLDEAWVKISDLPGNSWVTLGQEDPFIHVSRKTESYPILGHAFWQDEDLGIFTGGAHGPVYWRVSLTNGRRLKDRQVGEDNTFPITTDDDDNVEANSNKQLGIGFGFTHSFKENHRVDVLPFWYTSDLSVNDIAYLNKIVNYTGANNNDQSRYGLSLDYVLRKFSFFAQYMKAEDGTMGRDGWYIQPSFKHTLGMNRLQSVELLLRYEDYNVDLRKSPLDSRTWDRQTTTLAVISEITKGFKVKTEYYLNDEDTGGSDVDNNELLVQAEVKF